MRVEYGNSIILCKHASHDKGSEFIFLFDDNTVYSVRCIDEQQANELYHQLLVDGYVSINAESIEVKLI